jgi:hypothetical protein
MDLTIPQQKVDWNKHHIEGGDLQPEVVEKKFALWDYVMKNDLLNSPDEMIRNKAILLLDDPTIYEYAFFENSEGEPFKYEAYQDLIAQCKYDFKDVNDPNRFVLFVASNQIGKSRLEIGLARKFLFNAKGENIVIVTNNLKLTQFILSELKANLNAGKFADSWREDIDDVNNTTMLTVSLKISGKEYINRVICTPAGEGSLGYPIHRLFLDELDFYEEGRRLFWKVFYPRLNKTKGQIFGLSNPNTDIPLNNSILKELWDGELFKKKFHFNFLDASWNTKEEFETAKRNSPSHIFCSTHLGEWSVDSGSFFTQRELDDMFNKDWANNSLPITDRPVYVAMDLGKMRDNTVISIGVVKESKDSRDKYKDLDTLYQEELPLGTTYEAVVDRYVEIKDFYEELGVGVAEMGYDATGQKTFMDLLKIKGVQGTPIDFSAKKTNKTLLCNDLKLMVENRKIRVAYSGKCEKQLSNIQFKLTASKKYTKIENKTDKIHDDYFDSLLILVHVAVKPSRTPPSITYIKRTDDEEKPTTTHEEAKDYYAEVVMKNNSVNKINNYGGGGVIW